MRTNGNETKAQSNLSPSADGLSTLAPSKPVTITLCLGEGEADILEQALKDASVKQRKLLRKTPNAGMDAAIDTLLAMAKLCDRVSEAIGRSPQQ